tara:strand:+ start:2125 stop:2640 length:516 start_codon:yes stop_codon:yes gene_type:complete
VINLEDDPFRSNPIPGQSLTSEPGKLPYEKPPMYANTMEAFQSIKSSLYRSRESAEELAEIINSGISCETLASSIVISSFMKGMFNPDVAELIKPFVALEIYKIAERVGVTNIILFNKPLEDKVYDNRNVLDQFKMSIGHESSIEDKEINALIEKSLSKEHTDGFISKGEV